MGLFDKLRRMATGADKQSQEQQLPLPSESKIIDREPRDSDAFEATFDRRHQFWSTVGAVENDVLTYLISPSFTGGPAWPTTRQAFRVVRRSNSLILATDGLSDPFDDVSGGGSGYEMELFVETADIAQEFAGPTGDVSHFSKTWAFELLNHVAGSVANAGGIVHQLNRYGVLSMEIPDFGNSETLSQLPSGFVTADNAVGILIGEPKPDFPTLIEDMPLSPVHIVPIILIKAAELEFLRAGGAEARKTLSSRLAESATRHQSSATRASLV